jgi:hypothetical protein
MTKKEHAKKHVGNEEIKEDCWTMAKTIFEKTIFEIRDISNDIIKVRVQG